MQQTATDSAALAGAKERPLGDWSNAAKQDATNNGFTDNSGQSTCPTDPAVGTVCVNVFSPPQAGDAFSGDSNAVEVDITVSHPTFFEKVFGINKAPVTTKAVATLKNVPSNNCLYVLNGPANFNGATVNTSNCGLVFNDGIGPNNATITAAEVECPSVTACTNPHTTYTSATPQPAAPASDPCSAISFCAHMANPPPTCTSYNSVSVSQPTTVPVVIQPGCYSGINVKKATNVVFTCGLYVITGGLDASPTGGSNAAPNNITQSCGTGGPSGVTLYIGAGGSINLGNDNINLSAPTTGDYSMPTAGEQNVLIYQIPGNTSTVNMSSATCAGCQSFFQGMIYAPAANLNYNQFTSTTQGNVLIIAGTLNANGSISGFFNAPGGPPNITIQVPVLGE
jgi:hypothetical protein